MRIATGIASVIAMFSHSFTCHCQSRCHSCCHVLPSSSPSSSQSPSRWLPCLKAGFSKSHVLDLNHTDFLLTLHPKMISSQEIDSTPTLLLSHFNGAVTWKNIQRQQGCNQRIVWRRHIVIQTLDQELNPSACDSAGLRV